MMWRRSIGIGRTDHLVFAVDRRPIRPSLLPGSRSEFGKLRLVRGVFRCRRRQETEGAGRAGIPSGRFFVRILCSVEPQGFPQEICGGARPGRRSDSILPPLSSARNAAGQATRNPAEGRPGRLRRLSLGGRDDFGVIAQSTAGKINAARRRSKAQSR